MCDGLFRSLLAGPFTAAVSFEKSIDARLTIVYVRTPVVPTVPEQCVDAVTSDQLDNQARRWSAQQLEKLNCRAKRAGVKVTSLLRDATRRIRLSAACGLLKRT
jgi:hypothetical protein